MGKRRSLVPVHVEGDPTKAQLLVFNDTIKTRNGVFLIRITPEDPSLIGHVLSQGHREQSDKSYLIPVERK